METAALFDGLSSCFRCPRKNKLRTLTGRHRFKPSNLELGFVKNGGGDEHHLKEAMRGDHRVLHLADMHAT